MTIERHLAMLTLTVGVNVVLTAIAAAGVGLLGRAGRDRRPVGAT